MFTGLGVNGQGEAGAEVSSEAELGSSPDPTAHTEPTAGGEDGEAGAAENADAAPTNAPLPSTHTLSSDFGDLLEGNSSEVFLDALAHTHTHTASQQAPAPAPVAAQVDAGFAAFEADFGEEPKAEESKAEEPKAEEPLTEEPHAEEGEEEDSAVKEVVAKAVAGVLAGQEQAGEFFVDLRTQEDGVPGGAVEEVQGSVEELVELDGGWCLVLRVQMLCAGLPCPPSPGVVVDGGGGVLGALWRTVRNGAGYVCADAGGYVWDWQTVCGGHLCLLPSGSRLASQ